MIRYLKALSEEVDCASRLSTMTDSEAKEYGALNPTSARTEAGYATAIKVFQTFAERQKYPNIMNFTETFVFGDPPNPDDPPIRKVLAEFCTFLLGKHNRNDTYFKPDTQRQYFSGIKTVLVRRYPKLGQSPDWYEDLVGALKMRGRAEAIRRGDPISEKTIGISRSTLKAMCVHLMKQNTPTAYESRCVLSSLFHATGRGGEVSTSTWDSAYWDLDGDMLIFDWRETKKAEESVMTFHPDASSFHLDQFHTLACYLLAGQGRYDAAAALIPGGTNWIFPAYVNMADGGAAAKVTRVVHQCLKDKVLGLTEDMSGHGIRVSSADTMVFNTSVHIVDAICRGNWDFRGDCMIFHYLTKKLHVARAGKALAGWRNCEMSVSAPTLDAFKTSANALCLKQFCVELFVGVLVPELHTTLKPLRDVMVATLLMYREDVRNEVGEQDIIMLL
ncbi:MAG: hypothetical protein ACREOZ_01480, partial [Gloeomargaritales cyanobacterium]